VDVSAVRQNQDAEARVENTLQLSSGVSVVVQFELGTAKLECQATIRSAGQSGRL